MAHEENKCVDCVKLIRDITRMDWQDSVLYDIAKDTVTSGLPHMTCYDRLFVMFLMSKQCGMCHKCQCMVHCGYGIDRYIDPAGLRISRLDETQHHSNINSIIVCTACYGDVVVPDLRKKRKKKKQ